MKKNSCTSGTKHELTGNTTKVISVQENERWSGEVNSGQGNIRVTVNSVIGLFSRSAKIKNRQSA